MSNNYNRISWLGIVLVLGGALLLLDKVGVLRVHFSDIIWPLVMLLGLVRVVRGFSQVRQASVFFGTVLFLWGLFFFLSSFDQFDLRSFGVAFSSLFFIFAIAFLMMFFNNMRDWFYLIPALVFGCVGSAFFLSEWGYLYRWEIFEYIHTYWPVALILFGIAVIFRRRRHQDPAAQTVV